MKHLQKWHGAGNDFLIDVTDSEGAQWWSPDRAFQVCRRAMGIGADGVLVASAIDESHVRMTLLNADGSNAEMSGNGIRCLAAAVLTPGGSGRRVEEAELKVSTDAGERTVRLSCDSVVGWGEVSMGAVRVTSGPAPSVGVADVGNPHAVVIDSLSWSDAEREGVAAGLSDYLGGANVEFATVIDTERVRMVVHERGVGWTLACGTGSVATVAVLHERGLVGENVTVENPGGDLRVTLVGGESTLGGPVQYVGDVSWWS